MMAVLEGTETDEDGTKRSRRIQLGEEDEKEEEVEEQSKEELA